MLTRPSYNASRGTVSYSVKQINRGHLPARSPAARPKPLNSSVPRRCHIVGAPQTSSLGAANVYLREFVFPPGRLFFGGAGGP